MARRAPNYALVLILLLATSAGAHWLREKPTDVRFTPKLSDFPMRVGELSGADLPMEKVVRDALNADQVISRNYTDPEYGTWHGLLVVYRKYGRRDFIHRPELCYPAAGWNVVEISKSSVPYAGKTVPATKVVAEKSGAREIILYWFASGQRTECDFMKQQFRMAMDRFQTQRYGWAFIRINAPVVSSDEETLEELRAFAKQASDPLIDCLTTDQAQ